MSSSPCRTGNLKTAVSKPVDCFGFSRTHWLGFSRIVVRLIADHFSAFQGSAGGRNPDGLGATTSPPDR